MAQSTFNFTEGGTYKICYKLAAHSGVNESWHEVTESSVQPPIWKPLQVSRPPQQLSTDGDLRTRSNETMTFTGGLWRRPGDGVLFVPSNYSCGDEAAPTVAAAYLRHGEVLETKPSVMVRTRDPVCSVEKPCALGEGLCASDAECQVGYRGMYRACMADPVFDRC